MKIIFYVMPLMAKVTISWDF